MSTPKHPGALAYLDQGNAALAELVDVARRMLAEYGDEEVAVMVIAAFASMQPELASAAAFAAIKLAKLTPANDGLEA